MVDIKKKFKHLDISPSLRGLYVDTDGAVITPLSDTIQKKDFKWVRDSYSVVVPGLMEWYERYLRYVANPSTDFDWKGWHRDGLLFTKQIYFSLPRCILMRYIVPVEDTSYVLESFDVTEDKLDSLLANLGNASAEREPVSCDVVGVGVKEEEGHVAVRLQVKGKYDNVKIRMESDSLELLRDFLEKIAMTEREIISCESQRSDFGMYFYPQTIGGLKHMGQLHIFSERGLAFSAYINTRHFIRSLYRSITTHVGSLSDGTAYKSFQSNILECYIDDEKCENRFLFRKGPKLASFIGLAIENVRTFIQESYDSILDENEYV